MINSMKYLSRFLLILLSISVFSCIRHKNLIILDDKDNGSLDSNYATGIPVYRLQNSDILDISVASTDASSISIFTKSLGASNFATVGDASLYLKGYIIDDSGKVSMPIIGDIEVGGKTIYEVRDDIQSKINQYYKFATVDVKLLSFRISVLGEVASKGNRTIYRDNLNLLEAISGSGGFSDLANKREVKIIRTINGKSTVRIVDFTKESLINDEWYYLQPNDIIYVEPVRAKAIKSNISSISLALSAISLTLVVINFLRR